MIACRSCGKPLAEVVQGKAVIRCTACQTINYIVSQGSVKVDAANQTNVASTVTK